MPNHVDSPIQAYKDMAKKWRLPDTLMQGTQAMREAGRDFLPQEPRESAVAYRNRIERTVLFNAYKKAIQDLRGKVFSKPVALGESATERAVEWAEDIDLEGRDLTAFAFDVFESALSVGLTHILVDFPRSDPNATLADERRQQIRPYFVHVPARNLIGWKVDRVGGVRFLSQARIKETITEEDPDDEWGERHIEQVRVLEPGSFRIFRRQDKNNDWQLFEEGETSLDIIPLVTIYTGRTADMIADPPLLDLAYLNLAHWQSSSDQRHILHTARVPMLFGSGWQEDELEIEIGANRMITNSNPEARLGFVEHSGASIGAGRQDLMDLEDRMSILALEPLITRPGNITATERAIDEAKSNSTLQAWALNLEDALQQAFYFADQWIGQSEGADVNVFTDFSVGTMDTEQIKILREIRGQGDLSRETLWSEIKRRGIFDDRFDAEEEIDKLELEGEALGMIGLNDANRK